MPPAFGATFSDLNKLVAMMMIFKFFQKEKFPDTSESATAIPNEEFPTTTLARYPRSWAAGASQVRSQHRREAWEGRRDRGFRRQRTDRRPERQLGCQSLIAAGETAYELR